MFPCGKLTELCYSPTPPPTHRTRDANLQETDEDGYSFMCPPEFSPLLCIFYVLNENLVNIVNIC